MVGATGYTGVELLRLLVRHPGVQVAVITSRAEAGMAVADMYPSLRGFLDLTFTEPDVDTLSACDIVFFATPHGVAKNLVPALMQRNVRIIDISADFRLRDTDLWEQWYGQTHGCPELVAEAVYGLPETNREQIRSARLRSEEHTSELQSRGQLVCRLLLEKKNKIVSANSRRSAD